jgi:Transglutaminase-like superfamily
MMACGPTSLWRGFARRARIAAALARAPEDLLLLARMSGWALVLPMLKRTVPLATLARIMYSRSRSGRSHPERQRRIAALSGLIYSRYSLQSHCLERSLLLYRFLSKAAVEPQLVVGVVKTDKGWQGHAWIMVDGLPFDESSDALRKFCHVAVFSAGCRL